MGQWNGQMNSWLLASKADLDFGDSVDEVADARSAVVVSGDAHF